METGFVPLPCIVAPSGLTPYAFGGQETRVLTLLPGLHPDPVPVFFAMLPFSRMVQGFCRPGAGGAVTIIRRPSPKNA